MELLKIAKEKGLVAANALQKAISSYLVTAWFVDSPEELSEDEMSGPDDDVSNYDASDFSRSAQKEAETDLKKFFKMANVPEEHWNQAAGDLWYERNGHGVGFSDRKEYPEDLIYRMEAAAKKFKSRSIYVQDGEINFGLG